MASGSLVTRVLVAHSGKLPSSSTVDDVEGTLIQFIPAGYFKSQDEVAFLQRIKEDASSFRPLGQKIHSYTTPVKSKTKAIEEELEYEVYHVGTTIVTLWTTD
jgi:histone acetyltransferase 1